MGDLRSRREAKKEENAEKAADVSSKPADASNGGYGDATDQSFGSGTGDDDVVETVSAGSTATSSQQPTTEETTEDEWPIVSVEMGSRYKICSQDLETLFYLDCKYLRQVRWNGIADGGRIVISVQPVQPVQRA